MKGEILSCSVAACFSILAAVLIRSCNASLGGTWTTCSSTDQTISGYIDKFGYIQSDGYPGGYGAWRGCSIQIDLPNPGSQYIAFTLLDWNLDWSGWGDRISIYANSGSGWYWVWDYYAWNGGDLNGYRALGSVRLYWNSDGYIGYYWGGTPRWKLSWTFQRYVFGCELNPQPFIYTNTTKYGIIQSPYFPDHYPVNSYCQVTIDLDQSTDMIEFIPKLFDFRSGDTLYFSVGDSTLNNWVQYGAYTSNPGTIRIYGADVRILFTSDNVACSYGYQFYWRIVSKERYSIFKPESLIGFWPMTAAHRGNDIIQGCNAVGYPTAGTISPITGPFGNKGSALYFKNAYLNMTSPLCQYSTQLNSSHSIALFAQSKILGPIFEIQRQNGNGNWAGYLFSNYPSAGSIAWSVKSRGSSSFENNAIGNIQSAFEHYSLVHDSAVGQMKLYQANTLLLASTSQVGLVPELSEGFLFGYRDNRIALGGTPQFGRFSCMTMYAEALTPADLAQVRVMCQKLHQQYEIYPGNSLVGWWPLNSVSNAQAIDVSGNGRHGTIVGTADVTLTSGPSGAANQAYNFNGNANSYVSFPHSMAFLKSFTINFYVLTSSSDCRAFIGFSATNGNRGLVVGHWPSNADMNFNLNVVAGGATNNAVGIGFASWKFISASYDARTGNATVWVNGAVFFSWAAPVDFGLGVSNSGFLIGAHPNIPSASNLIGKIACVSLYSVALTAEQIGKVKSACDDGFFQPAPLVDVIGFWPLTNLTGTLDISGNEVHGTKMSSGVTLATGPFGVPNTAHQLGADTNAYINFPADPYTTLGQSGSFTWACYVKLLQPAWAPLIDYLGGPNAPGVGFSIHLTMNIDSLYFNLFGMIQSVGGFSWNQWQFVALAYDSNLKVVSLWRDGALLGTWSGTWGSATGCTTTFGFNLGYRAGNVIVGKMLVSCLAMYRVGLDTEGIGRVMSMCQSYLTDQTMRDQTKLAEIDCNFENGFCGWTQAVSDDIDWQLGNDSTPTGRPNVYTTGPRFGKSAERVDALDRYGYINSAVAGFNKMARLLSPNILPGWHCFQLWYYMSGTPNSMGVQIESTGQQIFLQNTAMKQWRFAATSFYLSTVDKLQIDGWTSVSSIYSDIAIDDIRVTDGRCVSSTPCPKGWLDFGQKCYMAFLYVPLTQAAAKSFCQVRLKAHLALPENPQELAYVQSLIGGSTIWLDGLLSSGTWKNSYNVYSTYLPWAGSQPGASTMMTLSNLGFGAVTTGSYGFICEVNKVEAQHLGFNCSFDNKHLCGWVNAANVNWPQDNDNPGTGGGSLDMDVWSGISLPWQDEDNENGPEWDFSKGNLRGYHAMFQDISCGGGIYTDLNSPIVKQTGRAQCLRFRLFRSAMVNNLEVILIGLNSAGVSLADSARRLIGLRSLNWRTYEVEIGPQTYDYLVLIRLTLSCSLYGNLVIDEIELFDRTCSIPTLSWIGMDPLNSQRPGVTVWHEAIDAITDANFENNNDGYCAWRDLPDDHGNWAGASNQSAPGFRRTGPQSDYTGEGKYVALDLPVYSLTGYAKFSGPPVPSGQRCFIFHYFMYGYDVGELRVLDGKDRSLFAVQRSQSPAWKEHRILFSSTSPTNVIFVGSSGFWDGSSHLQRYETIALDDIYVRNGTDICLGFFDCSFDRSSYLDDCGWVQSDNDDADWVRRFAETPATNAMSGPTADRTTGIGHYLYFDATGVPTGAKAHVFLPPIAAGNFCLTFHYYMWGKDIGGLRIFYLKQENVQFLGGNYPAYTDTTLWVRNGEQGNLWIRAMVPVSLTYSQILTFEAKRGNGDRGDIAIDDVVLLKGACPNDYSYSCSFERGTTCAWYNDPTAQRQFIVNQGKTPGAPMTGPEGDATGAYAGGFYAYLDSKTSNAGDAARLVSRSIQPGTVCFQVFYNMRGRQLGTLKIYKGSDVVLRIRGGSTGYEWRRLAATITSSSAFSIKIEAVRGASNMGDIAIDDISVTDGPCQKNGNNPPPRSLVDYFALTGFTLNGHNMSVAPNKTASASDCISQCTVTPGCFSVNYFTNSSLCQLNNASVDTDPYNTVSASSDLTNYPVGTSFTRSDIQLQNICSLDSPTCTVTSNCVTRSFTTSNLICQCLEPGRSCYMPTDCTSILSSGIYASGPYLIQPSTSAKAVMTWCDMDLLNFKAYTVLANRVNGGTRFNNRKLSEYMGFFGSPTGEFWIGLEAMNQLTSQTNYGYVIETGLAGTAYTPITGLSTSQPFVVASSANNYRVNLQQVGAMTTTMFNMTFSSIDADSTGSSGCPVSYASAGWWYKPGSCLDGSLTGIYRPNEDLSVSKLGMYNSGSGGGIGLSSMRLKITRI